jgi:chorismate mutase
MRLYLERIVPVICAAGNDNREYGSSANADINALQGAASPLPFMHCVCVCCIASHMAIGRLSGVCVCVCVCGDKAISKRIHYGKFVAEIKFLQEKEKYSKLIRDKDIDGIMNLLTHPEVEKKVLARVRAKSLAYGRDISEETSADASLGSADRYKVLASMCTLWRLCPRSTEACVVCQVDPDAIMGIYRDYVIPLTKEVEVDYLLQRLRFAIRSRLPLRLY